MHALWYNFSKRDVCLFRLHLISVNHWICFCVISYNIYHFSYLLSFLQRKTKTEKKINRKANWFQSQECRSLFNRTAFVAREIYTYDEWLYSCVRLSIQTIFYFHLYIMMPRKMIILRNIYIPLICLFSDIYYLSISLLRFSSTVSLLFGGFLTFSTLQFYTQRHIERSIFKGQQEAIDSTSLEQFFFIF